MSTPAPTLGEVIYSMKPVLQAEYERIWDRRAWRKRLAVRLAEYVRREA